MTVRAALGAAGIEWARTGMLPNILRCGGPSPPQGVTGPKRSVRGRDALGHVLPPLTLLCLSLLRFPRQEPGLNRDALSHSVR